MGTCCSALEDDMADTKPMSPPAGAATTPASLLGGTPGTDAAYTEANLEAAERAKKKQAMEPQPETATATATVRVCGQDIETTAEELKMAGVQVMFHDLYSCS